MRVASTASAPPLAWKPALGRELANLAALTLAAIAGVAVGAAIAEWGDGGAIFARARPIAALWAGVGVMAAALPISGHLVSRSWRLKRLAAAIRRLWRRRLTPFLALLWIPAIALVVFASGAALMLALARPAILIAFGWMIFAIRRAAARLSVLQLGIWALTGLAMGYFVTP